MVKKFAWYKEDNVLHSDT